MKLKLISFAIFCFGIFLFAGCQAPPEEESAPDLQQAEQNTRVSINVVAEDGADGSPADGSADGENAAAAGDTDAEAGVLDDFSARTDS